MAVYDGAPLLQLPYRASTVHHCQLSSDRDWWMNVLSIRASSSMIL